MGVQLCEVTPTALNMSPVVEDRQARLHGMHGIIHHFGVAEIGLFPKASHLFQVAWIRAAFTDFSNARLAITFADPNDIEEDSVRIIMGYDLTDLSSQDVQVRGVHAKLMISRRHKIGRPAKLLVRIADQPFRMLASELLIQTSGEINRRFDADFVSRFDLCA
ncbi:hypothetical protein D3C81_991570 [compost metagenome]